ncbi:riboflavin synthase subunit alpha [Candidatus Nasuia deltocephalinicola]|nr:riboflavin synthase subunit alpha [Candidatus Nasuia deltocephalinicola]
MFNGIIILSNKIFFLKYFIKFNYLFIKLNKKFFNINIGDSVSLNGICLTLIYKNKLFLEFEFSYITFLNASIFYKSYFNFEKSFNIFNNLNGHLNYGHINNLSIFKNIFIKFNIVKIYLIFFYYFRNLIIYKFSISLNGISFTINEIIFYKNKFILLSINIIFFTFLLTNLKFLNILEKINIEFDFSIFYIIKSLNY